MTWLTLDGIVDEKLGFKDFVSRRLLLSKMSSITEFRLKCKSLPEASVINLWLSTLLFGNPALEVLEFEEASPSVCLITPPTLFPPGDIMVWETLGVLKLNGRNIALKFPQSFCFPKLKVLHLRDIDMEFHSDSDSVMFAEGYPVIEDLRLEGIILHKHGGEPPAAIKIFLSTLKKLAIVEQYSWKIDIDTPRLQHLFINSSCFKEVKLCRCESIVSAHFHDHLMYSDRDDIVTLLNMVNNIKELHISEGFSECFKTYAESLPQFPYLTHLELTSNGKTMWILLQRAPVLKELVYYTGCIGNCLLPESEPWCVGKSLREIRIKGGVCSSEVLDGACSSTAGEDDHRACFYCQNPGSSIVYFEAVNRADAVLFNLCG